MSALQFRETEADLDEPYRLGAGMHRIVVLEPVSDDAREIAMQHSFTRTHQSSALAFRDHTEYACAIERPRRLWKPEYLVYAVMAVAGFVASAYFPGAWW